MTTQKALRSHRPLFVFSTITALAFLVAGAGSSAGIQGSGFHQWVAYGPITAFGSIFVEGVEYDISNALVTVDGKPASQSQLQIGQIVTVEGVQHGATGTAASVSFTGDVIGPIAGVDITTGSITVLGQTVRVDNGTTFGAGFQPAGLAALHPGLAVEVSAFADAAGILHASRVDLQPGGTALQVKGAIEALDPTAQTFRINDLTIDYSGVKAHDALSNGNTATVQALEAPSGNVMYATQVQVSSGIGGAANQQGEMEGLITSMASAQAFTVADQQVRIDSSTQVVLHGQALAPDLAVRVHGTFTASGVLLADQIEARPPKASAAIR